MSAEERRLAAIMFTDIVGYSALSERDEQLVMEILKTHHQLLRPLFPKYRGQEIKSIGDAFLVEFHSALEAVMCAIEMQTTIEEYNRSVEENRRFKIRIGIHLGDVIHRDGDVYGDGVNIASRIEPLAEPGGICISEFFYDQIRKRLDNPLVSLGKKRLKNIQEPIEIYKVVLPWEADLGTASQKSKLGSLMPQWGYGILAFVILLAAGIWVFSSVNSGDGGSPGDSQAMRSFPMGGNNGTESQGDLQQVQYNSIAVLPFANLSANSENEYFSDGLTEELINAFAKVDGLRVISRTSAFSFKGREDVDIRSIGAQLDVETILEGSVRRSGDTVRITAQLIRVEDDSHIWSESYDREMEDVFAVQDEIAQAIVGALRLEFEGESGDVLAQQDTENLEAYNLYLQGRFYWNKRTKDGFERAVEHFEQAVVLDPDYAEAYAGLADSYSLLASYEHMPVQEAYPKAKTAALKAIELDENLAEAHTSLGFIHENYDRDNEAAEREYVRAIELSPGYATAHHWYSILLGEMDRPDESMSEARLAHTLDPLSPIINVNLGFRFMEEGETEEAKARFEKAIEIDANFPNAYSGLMTIRVLDGDFAGAEALFRRYMELNPDDAHSRADFAAFLAQLGRFEEAIDEIERAQEQSASDDLLILTRKGLIYYFMGEFEQSVSVIERALEIDPESTSAMGLLAGANFQLGNEEIAVQYQNRTLANYLPEQDIESLERAFENGGFEAYVDEAIEIVLRDSDEACGHDPYNLAMLTAIKGDYDLSVTCLERAYENRVGDILNMKVEPVFRPLIDRPDYQALLREIGFPEN